jgi:hypothetical protein
MDPNRTGEVAPPARFPLTEEQVMGPRFLDAFREASQAWSLELYDPGAGGFREKPGAPADLLTTADMVWLRYACHVQDDDLGAPDAGGIIAFLDAPLAEQSGHKLWMAARALRILGGEPGRAPARYDGIMNAEAFAAHVHREFALKEEHHHEMLGLLPLIVSSGDPRFLEAALKAMADSQGLHGRWPRDATRPFNWSRTFAYTSLHLAAGRLPPQPQKILDLMERELACADKIMVSPLGSYHHMDALFVLVRLPAAMRHERTQEIRDKIRRGLPAFRREFLEKQDRLADSPHGGMLACAHILGLLQEAAPGELPSQRPFRFDWDRLDLYECAVLKPRRRSDGRGSRS